MIANSHEEMICKMEEALHLEVAKFLFCENVNYLIKRFAEIINNDGAPDERIDACDAIIKYVDDGKDRHKFNNREKRHLGKIQRFYALIRDSYLLGKDESITVEDLERRSKEFDGVPGETYEELRIHKTLEWGPISSIIEEFEEKYNRRQK